MARRPRTGTWRRPTASGPIEGFWLSGLLGVLIGGFAAYLMARADPGGGQAEPIVTPTYPPVTAVAFTPTSDPQIDRLYGRVGALANRVATVEQVITPTPTRTPTPSHDPRPCGPHTQRGEICTVATYTPTVTPTTRPCDTDGLLPYESCVYGDPPGPFEGTSVPSSGEEVVE